MPHHEFASAGTYAFPGNSATADSIQVAAEDGIDMAHHRARQLTSEVLEGADLVLGAETEHVDAVLAIDPTAPVALLDPEGGQIIDPYGASQEVYRAVFGQIRAALTARFDSPDE